MTLEWTSYSRVACPGGLMALVQGVQGTGSTLTMPFFAVWSVCLPHLSALSVTYHGQSIEISSNSPLMVAIALAISRGHDHGSVGRVTQRSIIHVGGSKQEQTAYITRHHGAKRSAECHMGANL